ncbi:carbon-nitrogen hydrolase [Papiliotrema laurentii]|uniref:Carbon-nitrogen hydrolase n=1 Tax=Papiliotrema laurentii TaxID=5418 RepID=A0AAD9CU22_PAPLA|nr:carbon-nitrogen hydrolase [Papiliotrema laurentii]
MTVVNTPARGKVNVALIQIRAATEDKVETCGHMRELVLRAVEEGRAKGDPLHMAVLPEMWNSIMTVEAFEKASEPVPSARQPRDEWPEGSYTCQALSDVAKEAGIWIIGGSIPEKRGEKLYNCATVYDSDGQLVKVYRKTHLFDLCLPTMTYKESAQFSPGDSLGLFETPFGKFAVAICYDIRFPELAAIAGRNDCLAMFYPAAFNMTTGPLHWELLQRSRALDNQLYVATCSPARDTSAKYVVWGHSLAVSPMGQVVASAEIDETIVHVALDPQVVEDTKAGIPVGVQRRFDLYTDVAASHPREQLFS